MAGWCIAQIIFAGGGGGPERAGLGECAGLIASGAAAGAAEDEFGGEEHF